MKGCVGTCSFGEIVKHVGDSAAEGQHDHEEGYQEHANILNVNKNVLITTKLNDLF